MDKVYFLTEIHSFMGRVGYSYYCRFVKRFTFTLSNLTDLTQKAPSAYLFGFVVVCVCF